MKRGREITDPIIPDRNGIGFPLEADLMIRIFANLMEQKRKDGVRFSLGDANNTSRET